MDDRTRRGSWTTIMPWVAAAGLVMACFEFLSLQEWRRRYVFGAYLLVIAGIVWSRRSFLLRPGPWRLAIPLGFLVSLTPTLAAPLLGYEDWRVIISSDLPPTIMGWTTLLILLPLISRDGDTNPDASPGPLVRYAALCAVFGGLALVHHLAVGDFALMSDEVIFWTQSRWMNFPQMAMPVDPDVAPFFRMRKVDYLSGQLYGMYPPGWPALLAVFRMAGLEWWASMFLGTASIALIYLLGRRLHSARAGLVAATVLATSQLFAIYHAGYMSHAAGMASLLAGAWCLLAGIDMAGWRRALAWIAAGIALGFTVTARSLTGLTIGTSIGLWMLHRAWQRDPRLTIAMSACVAAGGLIPFSFLVQYNLAVFGEPIALGHSVMHPGMYALGFGTRGFNVLDENLNWVSAGFPFGLRDGLRLLARRSTMMNTAFIPIGLLVPIVTAAVVGGARIGWSRVLLFALHPLVMVFYWGTGMRQIAELLPFVALGVGILLASIGRKWPAFAMGLAAMVVVSNAVAAVPGPRRNESWHRPWTQSDYGRIAPARRVTIRTADSLATVHGKVLLFSREATPYDNQIDRLYQFNLPRFDGRIVVARDLRERNVELMRRYPDYVPYLVEDRNGMENAVFTRLDAVR